MIKKGFDANVLLKETPHLTKTADEPLNSTEMENKRVDINILKARAKAIQDKENIKNTIIIVFFLIALGATGIFFSI